MHRAWLPGLAFGIGFMYVLIFWMRVVGYDAWIGLATVEALFYAVLGPVTALVVRRPWWPLWTSAAWTACEVFRSSGVTGWMPWGRVSYAMIDTPVAAAFPWLGGNGVTLVLALLGSSLAWAFLHGRERPRVALAAVAGTTALCLAPAVVSYDADPTGEVTVASVQGNIPGDGSDILLDHRQVTRNHVDATVRAGRRRRLRSSPPAGPRHLAGELDRGRPVHRPGDQCGHPRGVRRHRCADPGRRDRQRA